jgi:hypothetical protein
VHWVRPELVAVKYLTWTEDNLLRQVVYEGLREDKPAAEVRRPVPRLKPVAEEGSARSTRSARPKALRLTPFKLPPLGSVADTPKAMAAIVAAVLFGGHSYSPNSAS